MLVDLYAISPVSSHHLAQSCKIRPITVTLRCCLFRCGSKQSWVAKDHTVSDWTCVGHGQTQTNMEEEKQPPWLLDSAGGPEKGEPFIHCHACFRVRDISFSMPSLRVCCRQKFDPRAHKQHGETPWLTHNMQMSNLRKCHCKVVTSWSLLSTENRVPSNSECRRD